MRIMHSESRGNGIGPGQSEMEEPNKQGQDKLKPRRRKFFWCCGICCSIVLVVVVVLVILIFTVFKQRDPKIHVDGVSLDGLKVNVGNIFSNPDVSVDVDLTTNVTIKNPNYAGFSFHNSTAYTYYQDQTIATSPIPAGNVKARSNVRVSSATHVHVSGAISSILNSNLTSDINAGVLPLKTRITLTGTAKVLGALSVKNVRTTADCNLLVYVQNQTQSFHCKYKVKL